ncbi:Na+/H+ antiporter NhaC [Limosilactobacillus balticus]|uniref:Na+/H+ antiporter NhaC n=1 Tax=Limosilactobacillus balticus TaxID=2759747 RepID=UPI003992439A
MAKKKSGKPHISFPESLIVIICILLILGYLIIIKAQSPQVPLFFSVILLMFYGFIRGFSWEAIMDGIEEGIKPGIIPLVIFLTIGILIATWIYAGTIPTIMYFGFKLISIRFFLPMVFVTCSLIALVCGSSFTTISTLGIAFMGIGETLGISLGLTAGAIVSGAFFGANVSPLSGTANLAAAIGDVDLYDHIKSLMWTDLPAWLISIIIYFITGLNHGNANLRMIISMSNELQNNFWISWWALLPVILLLVTAWLKIPAVPSLAFGAIFAIVIGWIHKPISINRLANYIMNGYVAHTGNTNMDTLLSKGGISSMLSSLSLIIFALILGGLLISYGIIKSLIVGIEQFINSAGKLIFATAITCIGVNILVGEQYLSIILPGESFKGSFKKRSLPSTYLTRVLSDAGGAVNAIVPWSVSGVFISGALQINPFKYIPFAFFSIIVAILTILIGFLLSHRDKRSKINSTR